MTTNDTMNNATMTMTMTSANGALVTDRAGARHWLEGDIRDTFALGVRRVEVFVDWVKRDILSIDQIAALLVEIAVSGRVDGRRLDRQTFSNYCGSLSAVSRQLEDLPRTFVGSLDESADPDKKRTKKGHVLVAFEKSGQPTSTSGRRPLWRFAGIYAKIPSEAEKAKAAKPLDQWGQPLVTMRKEGEAASAESLSRNVEQLQTLLDVSRGATAALLAELDDVTAERDMLRSLLAVALAALSPAPAPEPEPAPAPEPEPAPEPTPAKKRRTRA